VATTDQQTLIDRINNTATFEKLRTIETNITNNSAMTTQIRAAVNVHFGVLARQVVVERGGIDIKSLSPAGEKIVVAVAEYVGLMKRDHKTTSRTFQQIKNRGLIGAAEAAVSRAKPTQGFTVLKDADRAELSYEQIIVDHPDEFSERALWYARRALGQENSASKPPTNEEGSTQARTELLLDWLQNRRLISPGRVPTYTNAEAATAIGIGDRRRYGRVQGNIVSRLDVACFKLGLPPIGLTAAEPFPRAWENDGSGWQFPVSDMKRAALEREWSNEDFKSLVDLTRGLPGSAVNIYSNYSLEEQAASKAWAESFGERQEEQHWVFVCNPQKWAIDEFLESGIEIDSWGVRPSDRDNFKPGQLAIIRVGQDRRSKLERNGRPSLEPGIYAVCEVLTEPYEAAGASEEFWSPGSEREPGWPTVGIRYLQTFPKNPLHIAILKDKLPTISQLLLDGFQGSTFPISSEEFKAVITLLGMSSGDLPRSEDAKGLNGALHEIEDKYKDALPEVKERQSRYIERGPAGAKVKKINNFKCQVCDALGRDPHTFKKLNGEPYVEAHHAMPVSKLEKGSLHAANIMTVCANHHRQLHFGGVNVTITEEYFKLEVERRQISIRRPTL
jgi:predicted RNA-binding protein with PUA-like domain